MTRQLLFVCLFFCAATISKAQSVGIGTSTPDASAILDISGTGGGLLVPRLTIAQRDAIANPSKGLLIFCTTDSSIYCFDGNWKKLAPAEQVWQLQGNTGTSSVAHFIGTKDTAALSFAVNNVPLMRLDQQGRLAIKGATGNTIIGERAGESISSGADNVFLGANAGETNTVGLGNTLVGAGAGRTNDGTLNTFVGRSSGYSNSIGEMNTFIGSESGYDNQVGNWNVMLGSLAGRSNTVGSSNTYLGTQSGNRNISGRDNVMVGSAAGYHNVGDNNTFVGRMAGFEATGSELHFLGFQAGFSNTTGISNHFSGFRAGVTNTTGSNNYFSGFRAGLNNSSGSNNSFAGYNAGLSNTSGSRITLLGSNADVILPGLVNAGAIGYNARVSQSNSFVIGGTGTDAVQVGIGYTAPVFTLHVNGTVAGLGAYINASDSRMKKNIVPIANALPGILQLRPVSYDWKKEEYPQFKFDDKRQIGFLAQELEKIFPEAVVIAADGYYHISYSQLVPIAIQGIKEQQQQLIELKEENRQLKNVVEALARDIEILKKKMVL